MATIHDLPDELMEMIFMYLPQSSFPDVACVVSWWNRILLSPLVPKFMTIPDSTEHNYKRIQDTVQLLQPVKIRIGRKLFQHLDFGPLNQLLSVQIAQPEISPESWSACHIAHLPIQSLSIRHCNFVECGSAILQPLSQLTSLDLSGACVWSQGEGFDAIIEPLTPLSHLKSLKLSRVRLTDNDTKHLMCFSQLKLLNLSCCSSGLSYVTRLHDFSFLEHLTDLRVLNLSEMRFFTSSHHLSGMSRLTELNLRGCQQLTTFRDIATLSSLTQLKVLFLNSCYQMTDDAIRVLTHLCSLTSLDLSEDHVLTDLSLPHLSALLSLKELKLRSCDGITSYGLECIAHLTQLTLLDLRGCRKLVNDSIRSLHSLSHLTSLNLSDCRLMTNDAVVHLQPLMALEDLNITSWPALTDDAFNHLRPLTNLTCLSMGWTKTITDDGIASLHSLKNLRTLNLEVCPSVTEDAVDAIKAAIPGLVCPPTYRNLPY